MYNYIQMASLTEALKARDLLKKYKIYAQIKKVNINKNIGCGFGIYTKESTEVVIGILKNNGFLVNGQTLDDFKWYI